MNLFELLVLNRLYGGTGGIGCGCVLSVIVFACFISLISKYLGIILICTVLVIILLECLQNLNKSVVKEQAEEPVQSKQKIKILAEKFINETITLDKPELDQDDYISFYEIVLKNNVRVENNYATEVPYEVRTVLYEAYIKIYNEFIEPNEIEIAERQEKAFQAEELKKTEKTREIFNNFVNKIKPYAINYIKTFLSKSELPQQINRNFENDEVAAFAYLIENDYNIEIPILEKISYDKMFLSENIIQSINNIPNKYCTTNKQECKLALIDTIISYHYAIEIYNLFETKLVTAGVDLKRNVESLIQNYTSLFNDNLIYVDLLLEYIQKYDIELPKLMEEDTLKIESAIEIYNEILKDNIIVNPSFEKQAIEREDILDCSEPNWKYFTLLVLIIKELELSSIKAKAKNIMVNMLNSSINNIDK